MSRTLKTLAFLSVATLLSVACERTPPARPNVVLIVIDTQRAQNLSLYGYERDTSPEFTRFAHEALTFELATAPGTWTVPTHASLFTGRWPSFHGAERVGVDGLVARPMNPEIPTLAELLQRDGYTTAAFVANVTYLSPLFGFQRGFDQFTNDLDWPRADHVATAVNDWLESQQAPFFLFVNLLDPHEPYEPPEPFDTRFDGKNPEHGTMMTEKMHARVRFTDEMRAHFVSQYDGETAFTDQALGTILDTLRARPDYGNSVVIVTSDHGEMLGEHQLAGHVVEPYEPELHVPLVAKLAGGRRAGERVEDRVSTMGVFATILDAVGIPLPEGTQAVRLTEPHPVFAEDVTARGRRVRVAYRGDHKLVSSTPLGSPETTRLFHLAADPGEDRPVVDGSGATRLREELAAFTRAPRPENDTALPTIDADRERKLRALGYVR